MLQCADTCMGCLQQLRKACCPNLLHEVQQRQDGCPCGACVTLQVQSRAQHGADNGARRVHC